MREAGRTHEDGAASDQILLTLQQPTSDSRNERSSRSFEEEQSILGSVDNTDEGRDWTRIGHGERKVEKVGERGTMLLMLWSEWEGS